MNRLKNNFKRLKYKQSIILTFEEFRCLHSPPIKKSLKPIFNLTHHTDFNNEIFRKNPKHIPLPNEPIPNKLIYKSVNNFRNSTYWRAYFQNEPLNNPFNSKFKIIPKPDIKPFPIELTYSLNPLLIDDISNLQIAIRTIANEKPYLHKRPYNPLIELQSKHPDCILTLADKNLGFVALYTKDYISMSLAHLQNPTTYLTCIDSILSITSLVLDRFKRLFYDNYRLWNPNEATFLRTQQNLPPNFPLFKSMPKMHKAGPVKSRPIVTSFNWYTRPAAIILNDHLERLNLNLPYVIQSSKELINRLPKFLGPNQFLVTIDIKSMYPNINRNELILTVNQSSPQDPLISTLLLFVLQNCYCSFQNQTYLQLQGIPMGDNASVFLANLFCDAYLDKAVGLHPNVENYSRYIDDLIFIWNSDLNTLTETLSEWNTLCSLELELTAYSNTRIDFLDLTIERNPIDNSLNTSVYFKPISKFNYISPNSSHPPHTLKSWVGAEIQRHYALTSDPIILDINLLKFKDRLLARGYTYYFLKPIFAKAKLKNNTSQQPNSAVTRDQPILHMILPYYTDIKALRLFKTVTSHLKHIADRHFPTLRPMIAYSTLPNLSSQLKKLP
jgi:Reverse transcriptase (RNA-dependent DNA polymerase).